MSSKLSRSKEGIQIFVLLCEMLEDKIKHLNLSLFDLVSSSIINFQWKF